MMHATPSFMDPAIQECPYPLYDRLLREAPVYLDPRTGYYVVSRYDDLRTILADPVTFPSGGLYEKVRESVGVERAERTRQLYETKGWLPANSLAVLDNPRHEEVRRIFDNAFRAGKIKLLEPVVRDTAYELAAAFADDGACELVRQYCIPLPLIVIGIQMGARKEDIWLIKSWTEAVIRRVGIMLSEEEERECVEKEIEGQHYFKGILDELRRRPDDSVLSDLVNTKLSNGTTLTDNEMFAHLMADTFVGGSETTTNALAAGVWMLCRNPDQYAKLKANPETYMRPFVEEVLRLESPVQGLFRSTARAVEFQGVTIPEGAILDIRFAAANRDPRHFECPEKLDLERKNGGSHLAFASGIHHCLGAPLARRELFWGFTALLDTIDNVRLTAPDEDVEHVPHYFLRAIKDLGISFDRRRPG
jgi:cytochrome P450